MGRRDGARDSRNPETVHGGGEVQAAESFNDGELTLPTKPPTAVLK
uniref:Uncharacterized protein n=1 Tax=Pyricularia oryzae (strain P131) TaxID=1143193 RepID=L7JBC1_PYRO1